ncbi:uncharacterized protein LOC141679213 [Apium graveolens]|uniref:uncharacterized protein LOC141679213 n=1 Tax=Apium graveolens TaxID=4045 RepID=UPI003D7A9B18
MKDSENIQSYHARVMEIVNQMRTYGDDIFDQHVVEKILISLTDKYENIVAVIEETKYLTKLSVKELMGSLQAHEKRRFKQTEQTENAFQSNTKVKAQPFTRKGGYNQEHKKADWRKKNEYFNSNKKVDNNDRGASFNSKLFCKICKKTNHMTSKCWFKGKPQCHYVIDLVISRKIADLNFRKEQILLKKRWNNKEEDCLYYACHSSHHEDNNVWFLDSDCINHMSENENIFVHLDTTVNPKVRIGNGTVGQAKGKGTIVVKTKSGVKYIHDVLLVPDLKENLLSVGQLLEYGYCLVFEDNFCEIFDKNNNNQAIAEVIMESNRNFPITFDYKALKADVVEESWLWHKRFCHLNFQGLKLLKQRNMVDGLPEL